MAPTADPGLRSVFIHSPSAPETTPRAKTNGRESEDSCDLGSPHGAKGPCVLTIDGAATLCAGQFGLSGIEPLTRRYDRIVEGFTFVLLQRAVNRSV